MPSPERRRVIRGLVLDGGGARGAYGFGCLLALKELGIDVDSVAGTSVGALNAAIWATDSLDAAGTIWREMRPTLVALRRPSFFLRAVATGLGVLLGWTFVIGWLVVLPIWFLVNGVWLVEHLLLNAHAWIAVAIAFVLMVACLNLGPPLYDTKPLRELVAKHLEAGQYRMPTYVTLAVTRDKFDPDNPSYSYTGAFGQVTSAVAVKSSLTSPRYVRLDLLKPKSRRAVLMATSAIDFLFPSERIGQVHYSDGAAADNSPIYPLVALQECEEILVVRLKNARGSAARSASDMMEHWREVDRCIRVDRMPNRLAMAAHEEARLAAKVSRRESYELSPPEVIPYRDPPRQPRIVVIQPKGGFRGVLGGVLDFRLQTAARLIDLGRTDCLRALEGSN